MRVLPEVDEATAFYWEAARRHELHVLRCAACRRFVHPPQPSCPSCSTNDLAPERVSGRGVVHTYTIAHREVPGHEVPFALVIVELEEQVGLRILSNLVDCPLENVRVGLPVEVTFEEAGGNVTLPQFRPRERG
ncbi:MAG: Zn-ribbon domain-containing OB-fold protein [Candidatus Binatia bacterium]